MSEKPKVFVCDDDLLICQLISSLVVQEGCEAFPVGSGEGLLNSISAVSPDLILLDIQMPDMDGFEVIKNLKEKEETKGVPFLFVSALNTQEDIAKGYDLGAVDYITKPVNPGEVSAKVQHALRSVGKAVN